MGMAWRTDRDGLSPFDDACRCASVGEQSGRRRHTGLRQPRWSALSRVQVGPQESKSPGQWTSRVDPAGPRAALPEGVERLDQCGGVTGTDEAVVDLVLGSLRMARPTGESLCESGSIEFQDVLGELGTAGIGKLLQLFDERSPGQVLAHDDVEAATQLLSGQCQAQASGM